MPGRSIKLLGVAAGAAATLAGCAGPGVQYPSGVPVTEMRPE